jgi:hypothetical protein
LFLDFRERRRAFEYNLVLICGIHIPTGPILEPPHLYRHDISTPSAKDKMMFARLVHEDDGSLFATSQQPKDFFGELSERVVQIGNGHGDFSAGLYVSNNGGRPAGLMEDVVETHEWLQHIPASVHQEEADGLRVLERDNTTIVPINLLLCRMNRGFVKLAGLCWVGDLDFVNPTKGSAIENGSRAIYKYRYMSAATYQSSFLNGNSPGDAGLFGFVE